MTDIPLPEPAMWYARGNVFSLKAIMQQGWHLEATALFDADQMRAYAAACVAAERERCARVVEAQSGDDRFGMPVTIERLAAIIRAQPRAGEAHD